MSASHTPHSTATSAPSGASIPCMTTVWRIGKTYICGKREGTLALTPPTDDPASPGVDTGTVASTSNRQERIPSDQMQAIKYLRGKLDTERNTLDRHFMYLELQFWRSRSRGVNMGWPRRELMRRTIQPLEGPITAATTHAGNAL